MYRYEPFLLPLLQVKDDEFQGLIEDPLQEENYLRRRPGSRPLDWPSLAIRIKETYGLPMVLHIPESATFIKRSVQGDQEERHPRYLIIRIESVDFFMMEHPAGLSLYDSHGHTAQKAVLLKPSLFARWWLKAPAGGLQALKASCTAQDSQKALHGLLAEVVGERHPSDWHLEPLPEGYQVRTRLDGRLGKAIPWSNEKADWLINSICQGCRIGDWNARAPIDASMELSIAGNTSIPMRISIIPTLHGPSLVIRFLYPNTCLRGSLQGLGFSHGDVEFIRKAFQSREGLWVVSGPTGTGKTTTLHALVQIGVEAEEKILAIEDPVERLIPGADQISLHNPPGLTYPVAMKAFLRQSPDTILIGEIRDDETAALAIQAARTGHRVLTTLHARTPAGVARRFQDLGQPTEDLESVLHVLLLQQLVSMLCPECKIPASVPGAFASALADFDLPIPTTISQSGSGGCRSCHGGYSGRRAVVFCSPWPISQTVKYPFSKGGISLLLQGIIDMTTLLPLLSPRLRASFALCQP